MVLVQVKAQVMVISGTMIVPDLRAAEGQSNTLSLNWALKLWKAKIFLVHPRSKEQVADSMGCCCVVGRRKGQRLFRSMSLMGLRWPLQSPLPLPPTTKGSAQGADSTV